jgi:antibiotic biosynthesis monooxygenase (ABM) superfamily enzyme
MAKDKMNDNIKTNGKAITIVVSRTVFPGHEHDYDEWVKKLADAAKQSPGNAGVTILVPTKGQTGLHHVVMYFADEKSMHQWETSYVRQKLSHEADAFSRSIRQQETGLETWFSIPECPELETPPAWKMALVTFIGVFLASCGIIAILDLFWKQPEFFSFNAVVGALLVSLLTWVVMPFFSRYLFRKWLHR